MAVLLGRSSGSTFLGRPLDVGIQAVLDTADSADACLDADVFYADDRVEKSRVRASLEKSGSAQEAVIRIRVSKPVDEPVVTVSVRAGCVQRTERRYVLLADPAPEQASAVRTAPLAPSPPVEPAVTPSAPAMRKPLRSLPEPPIARQAADRSAVRPLAEKTGPAVAARPQPKVQARLRLEPLDLSVESLPRLKPSLELLSSPVASEEQRSLAAALWKALTAEPQHVLEAAAKIDAVEADVRRLQGETRKNQAALIEFRAELQTARDERYANGLVYGLFAALVLALAGMALLWRRQPSRHAVLAPELPWWRKKKVEDTGWHSELGPIVSGYNVHDEGPVSLPPAPHQNPGSFNPEATVRTAQRAGVPSRSLPPISRRDQSDFALSMPHTPRTAKAEELFDVQHQAEFFISLGQYDQAIAVLRDHIGDDVQTSALIYLDLFSLYHQLKRKDEYGELRNAFNRIFNAQIPDFDDHSAASLGLEGYPSTLSRIEASWPTPKVLAVMEELIFHRPGDTGEPFDLEAYRELLFLYGIAREIVEAGAPVLGSLLDFDLPEAPFAASQRSGPDSRSRQRAAAVQSHPDRPLSVLLPTTPPQGVRRLGLDIDLDALADAKPPLLATAWPDITVDRAAPEPTLSAPAVPVTPATSGGNLIDFEALASAPLPSVKRGKLGTKT